MGKKPLDGSTKWELRTPCKSCPYRKDVDPGMWHRSEFESLLAHDKDERSGGTFGCHKYRERPKNESRFCAGWLMNQHERGMPSIMLRLAVMQGGEAAGDCLNNLHDDGNELYGTLEEMCEANHVYPEDARLKEQDRLGRFKDWFENGKIQSTE